MLTIAGGSVMDVEVNSRVHFAILDNLSVAKNQTPVAEIADSGNVVAHKEDRVSLPRDGVHPSHAFLLKLHVPDRFFKDFSG